ncbi:MAG: hypothetical protein NDJ89_14835 [Oligoflexia bacterium]|nr:hypothetical protein [Oligoflexia bacterium]
MSTQAAWSAYRRRKRLLTIRSLTHYRDHFYGKRDSWAHPVLRFLLVCFFSAVLLGLLSKPLRWLDPISSTLLGASALFLAVELADELWFRIYASLERATTTLGAALALLMIAGVLAIGLFPDAMMPALHGLSEDVSSRFEAWRDEKNAKLGRIRKTPKISKDPIALRGKNWVLSADDTHQRASGFVEAERECEAMGAGWGLPKLEDLSRLEPRPPLTQPLRIWLQDGSGTQLGPTPELTGREIFSAKPQEAMAFLCFRKGENE